MPERAEIEAAVHSSRIYAAAAALKPWVGSSVEAATLAVKMAVAAVEAADRVCDARGEYQRACRQMQDRARAAEVEVEQLRAINAELVEAHNTLLVEAARSPQGEDHEVGLEEATRIAFGTPTRKDQRHVMGEAINAYLSRVVPSRDGTVAVEDVRAQTIVGITTALRNAQITPEGGLDVTDTWDLAADFIEREFGSARSGESNEGGNQ